MTGMDDRPTWSAAPTRSAGSAAPSPRPAARRRRDRVDAGVAELLIWLEDQLTTGLARLQSQASARFDAMAARLVDAQAPGLAGRVRALAEVTASGPGLGDLAQAVRGFSIIATANDRDRGVNEMSSALRRRFNTVVLPLPATEEDEVGIVVRRVADLGASLDLPPVPSAVEEIRRVVRVFRELRSGVTADGRTRVKSPTPCWLSWTTGCWVCPNKTSVRPCRCCAARSVGTPHPNAERSVTTCVGSTGLLR